MLEVKTISLTGEETEVNFNEKKFMCFWVENKGNEDVYASLKPGIVPEADGIKIIPPGSKKRVSRAHRKPIGKLYLYGTGKVEITCTNSEQFPFDSAGKGGDMVGIGVTDSYENLQNLPALNGETILGNKSSADYHIPSLDENGKIPKEQLPTLTTKNLFDFQAWGQSLYPSPANGTQSINYDDKSITITATAYGCYTNPFNRASNYKIPVTAGNNLTLRWKAESDDPSALEYAMNVMIFYNGVDADQILALASNGELKFTVPSNITYITLRFGVRDIGETIKFSDIQLHNDDITIDTYWEYLEELQKQIEYLYSKIG